MANFDICFPFLLSNEDSSPPRYEAVPDPTKDSPGAKAISGINSAYFPEAFARIIALPMSQRGPAVKAFYLENFWDEWLTKINSNKIAAMILDASVNQGGWAAVKLAQIAAGLPESDQDGRFGPITLAAINNAPEADFVQAFMTAREARYREIGGANLNAWLERARRLPELA